MSIFYSAQLMQLTILLVDCFLHWLPHRLELLPRVSSFYNSVLYRFIVFAFFFVFVVVCCFVRFPRIKLVLLTIIIFQYVKTCINMHIAHKHVLVKLMEVTCQHPRSTPVEVNTTLSKTIFKGQRLSAIALTAFTSVSI